MMVNRSEFLKTMRNVRPALGKGYYENAFFFINGRVSAYNGELLISAPLPAGLDVHGKLPAKELTALTGKTESDEVEAAEEPERLFFSVEEMKARLLREDVAGLGIYDLVQPAEDSWRNLPSDFQEKLRNCLFSASKSKNEPVLSCVRWRDRLLETCDNIRIARCLLSEAVPDIDVLIPAETAVVLNRKNYDPFAFARTEDWLHIRCRNGVTFSCRVYADDFPPIEDVFALRYGESFRFPANSVEILQRSIVLADKDAFSDYSVRVMIDDGIFQVNAEKKEGETEEVNFVNTEESLQFWVNPLYLIEILQRGCDRVAVSEKSAAFVERFLKFEGGDFTHIIGVAPAGEHREDAGSSEDSSMLSEPIDLYCAGALCWEFGHKKLMNEMENRLLSFIYPKRELDRYLTIEQHRSHFKKIMIDSGAFSIWSKGGSIDFDEYTGYCKANIDKVKYVVSLDVIPGSPGEKNLRLMAQAIENSAVAGYANYRIMLDKEIPAGQVIHVFHQGEAWKWLKKMVEEMDYVGLSPGNDRSTPEKIEWLTECMRYVTDENGRPVVKFHGFAVTSLRLIKLFPWASVDSATWGIAAGMGRVYMPYEKGGNWDFSSDVPLQFACSQIKGHPAHVDNQPGLVQLKIVDAYLKELRLKKGKSSFDIRDKGYKPDKEKNERRVTKKLGIRIGQELSPTVIEELLGAPPTFRDPGPDKKWVETIIEPGVINSVELRQYLNIHYLNEFIKTLPKDRRFIRPENRVNLRWFLTERNGEPEYDSRDLERKIEEKVQQILSTSPIDLPPSTPSPVRADIKETPEPETPKSPQGTSRKRPKVSHTNSLDKIVFTYFAGITRVPFTFEGKVVAPRPLEVSAKLARGYSCPPNCGACCPVFSLDYLPHEDKPEGLTERYVDFEGRQIRILTDFQRENEGSHCKYVRPEDVRCVLHGEPSKHPFSCDFELIRFTIGTERPYHWLGVRKFGRPHSLTRFDGTRGAACTITEPTEDTIGGIVQDVVRKLRRLEKWATYFGLTETHVPEIINFLESTKGKAGSKWLYPKGWAQEQIRSFRAELEETNNRRGRR